MTQLAWGIVAGIACTYGWRKLIFGEVATDAADLGFVAAVLVVVAVAASLAPARRATRVDPVIALRNS